MLFDTFQDKFDGANGTALADHTPNIGGPWTDATPNWEIQGNACETAGAAAASHFPLAQRTGTLRAVFNWNGASGGDLGFYLGTVTPNYYFYVHMISGTALYAQMNIGSIAWSGEIPFTAGADDHVLQIRIGPAKALVILDGVKRLEGLRSFAPSVTLKECTVAISGGAGNSQILKELSVSRF